MGFKWKTQCSFRNRSYLPEAKVILADALLLHVAVEATTTAEYWRPQSTFAEQVVVLAEQETTGPWVPISVAVYVMAYALGAQAKVAVLVPHSVFTVRLVGGQGAERDKKS